MKIELFYAPLACSLVSLIALFETETEFSIRTVSLATGEQKSEAYLAVNPKGKVPALVVDGAVITENVAILIWLAKNFPGKKLLPEAADEQTQAISLIAWCSSGLHPPLTRFFRPERFCDLPNSVESVRALAIAEQRKNFAIIEQMLAGKEWVFGQWSVADAYLFWVWRRFVDFKVGVDEFPNYQAHARRMEARASVQKALAFERETLAKSA